MSFIEKFEKLCNKSVDDIKFYIPDIQRSLDYNTVEDIVNFQKDYYSIHNEYCLNHNISIGTNVETGISYLLDGQHRMSAYKILRKDFPERKMNITIDAYFCKGMDNINSTYKYINTNKPNDITMLGVDEYKILQTFEKMMFSQFKNYFKNTNKPIRPHLSMNAIKDYIKQENIIPTLKFTSGEKLFDLVIQINRFYSNINNKMFEEWGIKDALKVIEKINGFENKLYIGLYPNFEWIDRIKESVIHDLSFDKLKHITKCYRPKITKTLKMSVWKRDNGNILTEGKCYCCSNEVTYEDFDCGHIVPVSIGGQTNIDNLRVLCRSCNSDMRTMNLEEYKKMLQNQLN